MLSMASRYLFTLAVAVTLAGCSSHPSEKDGRAAVSQEIHAGKDYFRIVSFKKTNGLEREVNGAKAYEMEYEAQIEFTADADWAGGYYIGHYAPTPEPSACAQTARGPITAGPVSPVPMHLGDKQTFSGTICFLKKEHGWEATRVAYAFSAHNLVPDAQQRLLQANVAHLVGEARSLIAGAQGGLSLFHADNGHWPDKLETVSAAVPPPGIQLTLEVIDNNAARVVAHIDTAGVKGDVLAATQDGEHWTCSSPNIEARYLPSECRQ